MLFRSIPSIGKLLLSKAKLSIRKSAKKKKLNLSSIINTKRVHMSFATSKTSKSIKKYRVVFLGDMGVGKTSIIQKFTNGKFDGAQNATIGVDFNKRDITYGAQTYRLQMWDTAGQQRYHSLIPTYLKNANLAFLIFDVSKVKSLENIEKWYNLIREHQDCPCIIIGNKTDLTVARKVSKDDAEALASKLGLTYIQVSAKTGKRVEEIFYKGVQKIVDKELDDLKNNSAQTSDSIVKDTNMEDPQVKSVKLQDTKSKKVKKQTCCTTN